MLRPAHAQLDDSTRVFWRIYSGAYGRWVLGIGGPPSSVLRNTVYDGESTRDQSSHPTRAPWDSHSAR